ncbi:DUF2155 domain-containing protein [Commensalibacter oyaizuii]|uniref:DUF2155 domain-containing protein n=1 Tax=Commensalibacter oyaizuii TaxID=3043873 RepID=A0ABT6Q2T9_9PROT|nr:DUF2155 domain-containing protein [Commensalibacter sp. TBRC 16381]MDI2090881.1 DUF2155 domain-containing protein [Commensalibacter sp. TBRC 16381]
MKKILLVAASCILNVGIHHHANAEKKKSSSSNASSVSADTWLSQPKAVIRVLSKLESEATVLTIPVGGTETYKTLTISVKRCITRPTALSPDNAAFLQIVDSKLPTNPFAAWIFSAEPGDSVFEHPLYNVSMVKCEGTVGSEPLVAQPSTGTSSGQKSDVNGSGQSSDDLEKSLEDSIHSQH